MQSRACVFIRVDVLVPFGHRDNLHACNLDYIHAIDKLGLNGLKLELCAVGERLHVQVHKILRCKDEAVGLLTKLNRSRVNHLIQDVTCLGRSHRLLGISRLCVCSNSNTLRRTGGYLRENLLPIAVNEVEVADISAVGDYTATRNVLRVLVVEPQEAPQELVECASKNHLNDGLIVAVSEVRLANATLALVLCDSAVKVFVAQVQQNLPIGRLPLHYASAYVEILRGRVASRRCHTNKAALANKTNLAIYLDVAKGRNKRERITLIAHQLKREFANALNQITLEGEFAQINYSHVVFAF